RYINSAVIKIGASTNTLIEESEVYYCHRHGINIIRGNNVTARRNYVNCRRHADITGGYASHTPALGDEGLTFYRSNDGIAENNIVESSEGLSSSGQRNRFYGNIAAADNRYGIWWFTNCTKDCTNLGYFCDGNYSENLVSLGSWNDGVRLKTCGNSVMKNSTIIGPGNYGLHAWDDITTSGFYNSYTLTNSLIIGSHAIGFYEDLTIMYPSNPWSVDYINLYNNTTASNPVTSNAYGTITHKSTVDPRMNSCIVYVPATSPMKGAGLGGVDIGANIIYRYQNGEITTTKLWNQTTGSFPCGATVAGLNDATTRTSIMDGACINVHKILNVGFNGCPIP
ncbi:MAG TPA: hypothetical protein VHT73_06025, partial [Thermodesulfobacteriota bacterium]|nr:hypothetical protein [Thermodesulfobacteriota bacterium]